MHLVPTVYQVPNQPRTPGHTVRVAKELWERAKWLAERDGETMGALIRRLLEEYVKSSPDG
jgi:predicted DNA-binding protein